MHVVNITSMYTVTAAVPLRCVTKLALAGLRKWCLCAALGRCVRPA
jgi:hypothetical protein